MVGSHFSIISGTHAACGVVAGAAALVLEEFKDYTPAQVKRHLLNEATDGVVEIPSEFEMIHGDVNKFLYVGGDSGKSVSYYFVHLSNHKMRFTDSN